METGADGKVLVLTFEFPGFYDRKELFIFEIIMLEASSRYLYPPCGC
jgi:hypothetical protein